MTLRASLIATTVLAACVSAGPQDALAPAAVPGDWAAVSAQLSESVTPVTEDWVDDFADPALVSIIAEAISYNNNLAAAASRVRANEQRARVARADLLPTVGIGGSATRNRPSGVGGFVGGQPLAGLVNVYNSQLSTSWELDIWGRLIDQTKSAYLTADASRLDYAAAALSLAGSTSRSFYELTEARLQEDLARRDVETGEANLRIIERRYERGLSSSLDVRLARASLAQSQAQRVGREQQHAEAARRLEVLIGRYPTGDITAADALPEIETIVDESIGLGGPAAMLMRRPDVLGAERRLRAAGLDHRAAQKALLPSLSLNGAISGDTFDPAGDALEPDFSALIDPAVLGRRLTAQLLQPLFQGGRLRANVATQRSLQEAAVYDYADIALTAFREVEDAVAADTFLAAQLAARRLAFEEAAAAEELTERQYLSGTANIFDLISAQQRRIANESQFIAASRARLVNRIDLYLALGAPFSVPEFVREGGERFTPPSRDPDLAVAPKREGDA